jgi:hypothetical protein
MSSSPYYTTFADWLQYLFAHPEAEPEWYYAEGEEVRKLWDVRACFIKVINRNGVGVNVGA